LDAFLLDLPQRERKLYDRSSLERAATCPFQAAAFESGRVNNNSLAAAAGQEVHEAISKTLVDYIEAKGAYDPADIRNVLEQNLLGTRPDVQPLALQSARASIYEIAKVIYRLDPTNILAFDGGEELGKSGQLAIDLDETSRVTSEIDFLYAGDSPELLHEIDWKSGFRLYTASDVFNSFQFNLHALLVFEAYKGVNGLEVRVMDTRRAQFTFRVTFHRDRMAAFRTRLINAIGTYEHLVRGPEPPTWPAVEKCSLCPAASLCPVSGETIQQIATDPKTALRKLVAIEASGDQLKKLLSAYADEHGDIIDGDLAFGRNKPASSRRSPSAIYTAPKEEANETT